MKCRICYNKLFKEPIISFDNIPKNVQNFSVLPKKEKGKKLAIKIRIVYN